MEKDDETQMVETNVAEANEDPIVPKIDCLIDAMRKGDSEKALQLLEGIEDKDISRRGRERPITPLGAAIFYRCLDDVKLKGDVARVLVDRGADPNMPCLDPTRYYSPLDECYGDCTAFGMAVLNNDQEMIEFLVKHGADVNVLIQGYTSLQRIFGNNSFLLEKDDQRNSECLNAINDRCSKNILKRMRFLIKNGANVNARNKDGDTILHYVAGDFSYGGPFDVKFIKLLFKAGADPRIANNKGKLPLQKFKPRDYVIARFPERKENYDELVDMFQQRIDELNAQENKSPEE
jgi:hypothetical protein